MSDGMTDANAVGRLAVQLEEAAYELRDAIRKAEGGHRGVTVVVTEVVNAILREAGYELRRLPGHEP